MPQKETFDFDEHKTKAASDYRRIRHVYEALSISARMILSHSFERQRIKVHSIEARAKDVDSFANKAAKPAPDHNGPKYKDPLSDITDLAAIRVITFLPRTILEVRHLIESEFEVIEVTNKADQLMDEGRFGYQSVHYLVKMVAQRAKLPEYHSFSNIVFEIQVRTLLQHAWAEMEHDIQYKSASVIPTPIRRRFIALAGMLEIADREFEALQDADEDLRQQARTSVESGNYHEVEITPDALKSYLDRQFGPDGRMSDWSYEFSAEVLRKLGFTFLSQIDDCLSGYDVDAVSRALWGVRQGQISRFEDAIFGSMGKNFIDRHLWSNEPWFQEGRAKRLETLIKKGIRIGSYDPLTKPSPKNDNK